MLHDAGLEQGLHVTVFSQMDLLQELEKKKKSSGLAIT